LIDEVVFVASNRIAIPQKLWLLLLAEFGLVLLGELLNSGAVLCEKLLAERFTNHVSLRMIEHASQLELASFEDPQFYDKLERARNQTNTRVQLLNGIAQMCQHIVVLASLSAGILWFSPWLSLLMVVSVLPSLVGEAHFAFAAYTLMHGRTQGRRMLDYLRTLGLSIQSAKEMKLFGLAPYITECYRKLSNKFYLQDRNLAAWRNGVGSTLNSISIAGYYVAYASIILETARGALTIGDLTFLTGAFLRVRSRIDGLFSLFGNIADQAVFLDDLFQFFDTKPATQPRPHLLPAPRPIRDGFVFNNVSFIYPGATQVVLRNINFRLPRGERVALVGASGVGKTTIIKLLTRLYEPSSGAIFLDNIDLREYDIEDLRREIGVIFQDYMRYDFSVSENIGMGKIEELKNESRIREAAWKGLVTPLVERMPNGFDQTLGRRFDGGIDLSTGEWQRVALARAYMRDAQVLVLDEPTASLDARSEYEVFKRFASMTKGRTTLLVSHRFSTVRMADRILVLDGGHISEEGTHDQLVAKNGQYAELFSIQAAGYR
jgi:ATP-binding cassette subfamily B protein